MWVETIGDSPPFHYRGVYRDVSGRRHSKVYDHKKDAKDWAQQQEQSVRRGTHRDPRDAKQPIRDYAQLVWWPARSTEATTSSSDLSRLNKHVLPRWGGYPIGSVLPSQIRGWVNQLVKEGLSVATARACHGVLRSILESAKQDKIIAENPAVGLDLPKPPPGREVYLTREEVDAVAAVMSPFDAAIVYTLVLTGMRWGELAGLQRYRVQPLHRRIRIARVMIEVDGRREFKEYPKGHNRRTVPMPAELVEILAAHMARCPGDREDLVFRPFQGESAGNPRRGLELSRHDWPGHRGPRPSEKRHVTNLERRARLRRLRFYGAVEHVLGRMDVTDHDLRHTYASWLVQGGVDLYRVQRLLGHKNSATTQRYAHLVPDEFDAELRVLDQSKIMGQKWGNSIRSG